MCTSCCFTRCSLSCLTYLRNSFRSPACIIATIVLVTDVPMLAPMTIGTAVLTSSTEKYKQHYLNVSIFIHHHHHMCVYLQPEDTMLTTIEEEVLELWTSTVTNTPITSPATGLASTALSWKMSPAALPAYTNTLGSKTHIHCIRLGIMKSIKQMCSGG